MCPTLAIAALLAPSAPPKPHAYTCAAPVAGGYKASAVVTFIIRDFGDEDSLYIGQNADLRRPFGMIVMTPEGSLNGKTAS